MGWNYDPDAIHSHQSGEINALTEKTTPADDDLLVVEDSADANKKKKVKVGNLGGGAETLDDLTDVDTTGVADGDALVYDADTSTWGPGEVSGGASYSETVGDTSETTFNIAHGLDTSAVVVEVIEVTSGDALVAGTDYTWSVTDDDTIQVVFDTAPDTDDARIVVLASGGTSGGGGGGGGGIGGAYDIEAGTYTDAGLSDEFEASTLDAQWTAINMSPGTVNPITANPPTAVYDLSTRPGTLLVQLKPAARAYLRADSFIADGEQIIASIGIATPGHTATGNNHLWVGIGYNDGDTDPYDGNDAQLIWDGTNDSRMLFMHSNGNTIIGVNGFAAPPSRRSYFRFMRSGNTIYGFHSHDGIVWSSLNSTTRAVSTANNFWLVFDSNGNSWTHAPIITVQWVRHVANLNFDPWG